MSDYKSQPELLENLRGKTAIVTGGANGIGAEIVRSFNSQGVNVVIADLASSHEKATALISGLSTSSAIFIPVELSSWQSTKTLFKQTVQHFGHVDIVAANAGVIEQHPFFDFSISDEEPSEPVEGYQVIDVNLKGTLNTLKLAFFYMAKNPTSPTGRRGAVVLTASTSSYFGGTGTVAYVASKHGVLGLLRGSLEVAEKLNITINAVAPSLTKTSMAVKFVEEWEAEGLPSNTARGVAEGISQLSADPRAQGKCCLVFGNKLVEVEEPRNEALTSWLGEQTAKFVTISRLFFGQRLNSALEERFRKL